MSDEFEMIGSEGKKNKKFGKSARLSIKTHSNCHLVIGVVNGLTMKTIAVEPASSTVLHWNNNRVILVNSGTIDGRVQDEEDEEEK